jgi:hypothetical protein
MRFIARGDLENAGLDLDKTLFVKKAPHRLRDCGPRQQERLSVGVPGRQPPWRRLGAAGHQQTPSAMGDGVACGAPNRLKKSADTIDIIWLSP